MLERLKYDRERVANELMAEVRDIEGREIKSIKQLISQWLKPIGI